MALIRSVSALSNTFLRASRTTAKRRKSVTAPNQYSVLEPRQLLAAIAWSSGDITGNSEVSSNGSLIFALNGSDATGATTTVNGVDFVASDRANAGAQAQTQSPGNESIATTLGFENGTFFGNGGLTSSIGDLIEGAWIGAAAGDSASVALTGLTVGDTYEVQLFASDTFNAVRDNDWITVLDNGAGGTGINLELNNRPTGDSPGDFGIGTFTADSSTQSFNLTGIRDGAPNVGRIQVNAIQLRKLETGVVLLPGAVPLINEFSASNSSVIDDDNGNSSDWIEIYNAGEDSVNLGGYSLTDDPTNTIKYVLPSTTLASGQYLIVFAGDDADPASGSDLYTGFGLSAGGEYLGFYDDTGALVSEFGVGGTDYPAQFTDVSYGFENDNTFSVVSFFATPTPGAANVGSIDGVIQAFPTFSVDRGFHDAAFTVDIDSTTPGATLVYTIDGTEPSLTNGVQIDPANASALAQASVFVSTTTSLRAAAFKSDFFTRGSATNTYVFLDDTIASDLDPDIAENPLYVDPENDVNLIRDALLDIPTLSFNYDNVIENRDTPEQRASIEWLAPDGSQGFQIDAGIDSFGGQNTNFDKKSFRLHFRSEYGASRLDFPIFEGIDDGGNVPATDSFDQLEFRSGSHDRRQRGFLHSNRFVDDTILDAGHVSPHGRFVHIYINGTYWGQYHMRERWNADFLAQYYGGDKDDYTALNGNRNNGNETPFQWDPGVVYDGDDTVWNGIHSLAGTFNGTVPTGGYQEIKQIVNMEQYIDFMLIYMAGASESEYRAGGATDGSVGYIFYLNDADGWLRDPLGINNLRQGGDKTDNPGPLNILGTLVSQADPEFMTFYADRIQKMFFGDGPLTAENSVNRLQERMDEVELSVLTEFARWGGHTPESYIETADIALNTRLPALAQSMIDRLRAQGVFPSFDAPKYLVDGMAQHGGTVTAGAALALSATGLIYYTTDGSDPRSVGGGLNPNAIAYNSGSPIILTNSTNVKSRTLVGGEWSGLSEATFAIPVAQSEVRISEVHYNPADPTSGAELAASADNNDFEFLEIYNPSPVGTINLGGMQFDNGITFGFGDVDLAPGERAVIVSNLAAFQARYGTIIRVLGEYAGSLSNSGEQITLLDSSDQIIQDFTYDDAAPWPVVADGNGSSLEVIDLNGNYSDATNWRASATLGGTPGVADLVVRGDLNGDGVVNNFDISAFALALLDRPAYTATYPGLDPNAWGDFTGDGVLNNFDISGFAAILFTPAASSSAAFSVQPNNVADIAPVPALEVSGENAINVSEPARVVRASVAPAVSLSSTSHLLASPDSPEAIVVSPVQSASLESNVQSPVTVASTAAVSVNRAALLFAPTAPLRSARFTAKQGGRREKTN